MRKPLIVFFLYLLLTFLFWFLFGNSWYVGDNRVPPAAKFFSPFHGFWQNAELPNEFQDIAINSARIQAPVEIAFDQRLVPFIFAENEHDAAYAQGYLHARFRMWQIDVSLRDITGRLSEVFGERTLNRDRQTRQEGFTWAAEENLKVYMQDTAFIRIFESYLMGFNDYLSKLEYKDYPLEYKMLDYKPIPLTLLDMVALTKNLARTLTTKQYDQANQHLIDELGDELFDELFPLFYEEQSPVHPSSSFNDLAETRNMRGKAIGVGATNYRMDQPEMVGEMGFASNNWAIGPEKSKSGAPILCNDPHLKLTLPSIWYETAVSTPEYKVHGVSMPGLPTILIGFNEYISWGITNGGHDVMDILSIKWVDEQKTKYIFNADTLEVNLRFEKIRIKDQGTITDTIKYTRWGPIVSQGSDSMEDLTMHWTAHYAVSPDEIMTFYHLNRAKGLDDYLAALASFPSPIQNVVFASRQGDIALKTVGHWPRRANHSGLFLADGSDPSASWNGLLGFDENPLTINPDRQFVSSANQHTTNPDFPEIYFGYFEGFRGRILNRYLEDDSGFDSDDMARMQLSNYSLKAEEALKPMLDLLPADKLASNQIEALNKMRKWDLRYEPNLWEPVLFDTWYSHMERVTFDETRHPEHKSLSRKPEKWVLANLLKSNPDHPVFDDMSTLDKVENVSDMLYKSFLQAWEDSGLQNGLNTVNWNEYMNPTVYHLAQIPAFSVKTKVGGSSDALNAISHDAGPSWRMIVELNESGPIAKGVYPGGQSGNPGSRFYDDMINAWSEGKYYSMVLPSSGADIDQKLFTVRIK